VTINSPPGPDHDPGYLASLRHGTGPLGATRRLVFGLVTAPVLLWLLLPLLGLHARRLPAWALLVVAGAVLATMMLSRLVLETIAPLSPTLDPRVARSRALVVFRSQVVFQVVVAQTPLFAGFVLALAAHSPLPWVAGFLLGWPLTLLSLPTTTIVERVRQRLEAYGAPSGLWETLLDEAQ